MHDFLPIAYFEGKFTPFAQANISIATHALHYGTGAFGGLRGTINPANPQQVLLFRLNRHCQRLSNSAKYLHYDLPANKIEILIPKSYCVLLIKNRFCGFFRLIFDKF